MIPKTSHNRTQRPKTSDSETESEAELSKTTTDPDSSDNREMHPVILRVNTCISRPREHNIEQILMIMPVEYSRDQLLMRKDIIAHFMSVDCEVSTPICQQLVDLEMIDIDKLKIEPIGVGAILQTKLSTGKIIYSLFIKDR